MLNRIARAYAEGGLRGILRSAASHVYERTEFVAAQRDLLKPPPDLRCALAFDLRRVDDRQLDSFRTMPSPFNRHWDYRFTYGMRRCYAAYTDGRVVALMWPVFEADNRLIVTRWRYLLPDEARISNAWADRSVRGTGLIAVAYERLTRVIAAAGFRYIYGFTWINNHASRKFQARMGYNEVGNIVRYSFAWQPEGRGLYLRDAIPRDPVGPDHPGGDMALPEVIR